MTNKLPEYIQDAKFIKPGLEPDEDLWPRDPSIYEPTEKFIQRFKDFGSFMDGDIIEDAIKYGELYTASRGCVTFINDLGGVAFYIVVTSEPKVDISNKNATEVEDYNYRAVSIWPYVYNREQALDTGRWSSRFLDKIQNLTEDGFEEHIGEYDLYVNNEDT